MTSSIIELNGLDTALSRHGYSIPKDQLGVKELEKLIFKTGCNRKSNISFIACVGEFIPSGLTAYGYIAKNINLLSKKIRNKYSNWRNIKNLF